MTPAQRTTLNELYGLRNALREKIVAIRKDQAKRLIEITRLETVLSEAESGIIE